MLFMYSKQREGEILLTI